MTSDDTTLNEMKEAVAKMTAQVERERLVAQLLGMADDHERTAYQFLFDDRNAMLSFRAAATLRKAVDRLS